MLEECGDQIEADLSRFHHVDLLDLYRGSLTYRKVWVLLQCGLPPTSALAKLLNDGEEPWTLTDFLLSDLWALQVQRFKNPPKMHPWRERHQKRMDDRRQTSRRAKLVSAQQRRR